jgi:P4 family phage/plasmid primase-like protien
MTIDIQVAKDAARGHWPTIANRVFGIPDDYLTQKQGPCPKCKCGTDRWKVFKDFDETGGAMCNQCGKSADGFALGQWWLGCSLNEAIEKVCQFLGVEDSKPKTRRKNIPSKVVSSGPDQSETQKPAKELPITLRPWNDKHFGMCFANKKPISMEAVKLAGGTVAKHYGDTVMAFPCIGRDGKPSGWAMFNITGGPIKYRPNENEPYQDLKIKLIGCQGGGWIGRINPNRPDGPILKVEGVSDVLTVLSSDPEASVITNANGAGQDPLHKERQWMLEVFRGRVVYTIHDRDDAGQDGALWTGTDVRKRPGWAVAISLVAKESRNVELPFEMNSKKPNRKDVRDFFNDRLDQLATIQEAYQELVEICEKSPVIVHPEGYRLADPDQQKKAGELKSEAIDDPHRLARINLERYWQDHSGKLVFWRNQFLKYSEGSWKFIDDGELRAKVNGAIYREFQICYKQELAEYELSKDDRKRPPIQHKVTRNIVSNVIAALEEKCIISSSVEMPCWLPTESRKNYLAFENGLLDLDRIEDEDCLLPLSHEWFAMNLIDYQVDPEATCPKWCKYIDFVSEHDHTIGLNLQEFAGYLLMPHTQFQRWLILEGEGHNGKTVYLAGLRAMLGDRNVSDVTIDLFGERFALASTVGKMLNISADLGEIDSVAEGAIKQFVGGDTIMIDRKNREPISVRPTAKLIAAWNNRPRIKDRSRGMWRRMLILQFSRLVQASERIRGMDDPKFWAEEAAGILNWAIVGMHRLNQQGEFTESPTSKAVMEEYKTESNPTLQFFADHVSENVHQQVDCQDLYEEYRKWCLKNGNQNLSSANFGKEIRRKFPTIERKRHSEENRKWFYQGIFFENGF